MSLQAVSCQSFSWSRVLVANQLGFPRKSVSNPSALLTCWWVWRYLVMRRFWFVKTVRPSVRAAAFAFQSSLVSVPIRPPSLVVPSTEPRLHLLFCLLPVLFFLTAVHRAWKAPKRRQLSSFGSFLFFSFKGQLSLGKTRKNPSAPI